MCLYVRRTVKPGGKTARMISPAKLTGTRDGTGAQVGPTLRKHKADMHVCACISLINHSKHIPSFAKTFSHRDFLLLLLLHLHLCRNNTIKIYQMHSILSQVSTNVLKVASAVSGLMFFPHPNPCVKKSGPTLTSIPHTPKPLGNACSSGSPAQTPTRRLLSTTSTMGSNSKALLCQHCSSWLSHLSLCNDSLKLIFLTIAVSP